jgi:periplasmic divalent cation tolerance protein
MSSASKEAVTVVVTTAPNAGVAESMGRTLVEERLAACANVVPGVTSVFRWEGEVQTEGEVLVVLKSTEAVFASLRDRLVELHPYDVPEVLRLSVADGSDAYLDWVREEVRRP